MRPHGIINFPNRGLVDSPWRGLLVLGIGIWSVVGSLAAQSEEIQFQRSAVAAQASGPIEPHLTCELTHEEDWERTAEGTIRISNLTPIQLLVELKTEGVEVEDLKVANRWDPDSTVDVNVYELGGEGPEAVPVKLSRTGGGGSGELQYLDLWLDIPVTEETWKNKLEQFLAYFREVARKEGELAQFERLTSNPEAMKLAWRNHGTWNRPGRFEVQCNYKSDTEGIWNGELKAEPLILEVANDGTVFDKMLPPDEEEP